MGPRAVQGGCGKSRRHLDKMSGPSRPWRVAIHIYIYMNLYFGPAGNTAVVFPDRSRNAASNSATGNSDNAQ